MCAVVIYLQFGLLPTIYHDLVPHIINFWSTRNNACNATLRLPCVLLRSHRGGLLSCASQPLYPLHSTAEVHSIPSNSLASQHSLPDLPALLNPQQQHHPIFQSSIIIPLLNSSPYTLFPPFPAPTTAPAAVFPPATLGAARLIYER